MCCSSLPLRDRPELVHQSPRSTSPPTTSATTDPDLDVTLALAQHHYHRPQRHLTGPRPHRHPPTRARPPLPPDRNPDQHHPPADRDQHYRCPDPFTPLDRDQHYR